MNQQQKIAEIFDDLEKIFNSKFITENEIMEGIRLTSEGRKLLSST